MNYNDYLNNQKNNSDQFIDLNKPKQMNTIKINDQFDSLNNIKIKLIELENSLYDDRNKNVSKVSEIIELVQYLQRDNN